jgi:hypothetical protein
MSVGLAMQTHPCQEKIRGGVHNQPPTPRLSMCRGGGGVRARQRLPLARPRCITSALAPQPAPPASVAYLPATLHACRPTWLGSAHSDRGAMFPVSRTPGLVGTWRWANPFGARASPRSIGLQAVQGKWRSEGRKKRFHRFNCFPTILPLGCGDHDKEQAPTLGRRLLHGGGRAAMGQAWRN